MPMEDARVATIRNQIANELLSRKHQSRRSHTRMISGGKGCTLKGTGFEVVTTKLVEHLSADDSAEVAKSDTATLQIKSQDGKITFVLVC